MVEWEKYSGGVGEVKWTRGISLMVVWEKYGGEVGEV